MTPEIVSIQLIEYGVDAAGQPLPQGPYGIRYVYIYIYITDSPWLIAHMLHNIFKIIVYVLCKYMNYMSALMSYMNYRFSLVNLVMLCYRWCNAKCQKNVSTHVLLNYRSALGMQHPNEVLYLYLVYIHRIHGCHC